MERNFRRLFKDFVEYCLPDFHGLINWKKQWHSLDKELNTITKGSDSGKRLVDKLFKIFLKDGREQWVLVHLEIQGKYDADFPKRMFTYGLTLPCRLNSGNLFDAASLNAGHIKNVTPNSLNPPLLSCLLPLPSDCF